MFKKLRNIETAFQHVRGFTVGVIMANTLVMLFMIYHTNQILTAAQHRIYILYNGKVLEALAGDRENNILVEARDHIKTFHELFFTLDPDDKVIQRNLGKALYLADESAKTEYDNLTESGYYANIISGNISQQIEVDSISLDIKSSPYQFRCYATLQIIRTTSTVTRSLITEGQLRKVSQSDNNPHGFLIQRWSTIENKDIKAVNH